MPAKSIAQRRAIAIAEHDPSELFGRNRSLLSMKPEDMHDFAATLETGLRKKKGTVGGSFFGRKKKAKK